VVPQRERLDRLAEQDGTAPRTPDGRLLVRDHVPQDEAARRPPTQP
jgi:hypothetical protein